MGYETKLYVVETNERTSTERTEHFARRKSDGKYTEVFTHLDNIAYEADGNTPIHNLEPEVQRKYCRLIGMVDLCKAGYSSKISTMEKQEAEYFFYESDGNSVVIEDSYGDKLRQADLVDVIAALEEDVKDSGYRRFETALGLLKGCVGDYNNVKVLFFGY